VQRIAGWVAVAAALVYVGLKALWVAGSMFGVRDLHGTTRLDWAVDNIVTGALGLAGVAVALATVRPWGRRLPVWLVATPMWIGGGLLAPLLILLPALGIFALAGWWSPPPAPAEPTEPELEPWTFVIVYGSFVVLGAALLLALAGYARARFGAALRASVGSAAASPTRAAQVPLAWLAAAFAAVLAVLRLWWALGGSPGPIDAWTRLGHAVTAAEAVAGAAGLLTIVHGWAPRRPLALPLLAVWLGAGGMLAAGALSLPNLLSGDEWAERGLTFPAYALASFVAFVAGGLLSVVAAFAVSAREHAGRVDPGAGEAAGGRGGQEHDRLGDVRQAG